VPHVRGDILRLVILSASYDDAHIPISYTPLGACDVLDEFGLAPSLESPLQRNALPPTLVVPHFHTKVTQLL